MNFPLSADDLSRARADFANYGFVHIKGIFANYVDDLRAAMVENQGSPSWRQRTYHPEGDSAPFFQDYVVWDQFEGYRKLVKESCMAKLAAQLMGSQTARIFHDHVLLKFPGTSVETPWHHDAPYYIVSSPLTCSFWVACDPVPRNRSIEYVAGSHKWADEFRPQRFDGTDLVPGDDRPLAPNIAAHRDDYDIRGFDVEPGDAVAFDFRVLHGAPANNSDKPRRVTSIRWVGDGAVFKKRHGVSSPSFPSLDFEDGDMFDGEQFPVIYSELK
ncbi:MAG: phytanoyl-CoA dioxygenase family protein [Alphaproteobacteria bacterium]